ncbi:ribonuclease H-like domain-containing protein [Tanacetum coccineum]
MHDPRESYLVALKRIFRYVRGTHDHGLHLHVSTTSSLHTLMLIGQVAQSFDDPLLTEYLGVANVVTESAWIHNLLRELHACLHVATPVYCDNVSSVYLSTKLVQH